MNKRDIVFLLKNRHGLRLAGISEVRTLTAYTQRYVAAAPTPGYVVFQRQLC
jgi:hypothetical protein